MPKRISIVIVTLALSLCFGERFSTSAACSAAAHFQKERININTASVTELMRLPGIGQKLAERVIAHRTKHGAFKRPQDIIIVRGFSANRYRQLAHLIRT